MATNEQTKAAELSKLQKNSNKSERDHWLLVCPPDNWKGALPISFEELKLLDLLSLKLDLFVSRDDQRKKVYLDSSSPTVSEG